MKYLKSFLITLAISLIIMIISSSLCYLDIINNTFNSILIIIGILLASFVGGVYIGTGCQNKGYLEGIKVGGILIIFLILLSYLGFNNSFTIIKALYYLVLFILSVIGSIVGINLKK